MTAVTRLFIGAALALLFSALFPGEVHAQTPPQLNIALLAADSSEAALDVQQKLSAAGLTVAIIDVSSGPTPTLAQLRAYDAILTWSSFGLGYADAASLGDVLAAYVDEGHGVVEAGLSFSPNTPARLDGAWRMGAYEPLSLSWLQMGFQNVLVPRQPAHPILDGVISFNGGNFSGHHESLPQGCSEVIAHWSSNGWPLVAARRGPRGGRIIGLNFYPVSSSVNVQNWDATTDGARLMANALRYAATPVAMPPSDGPVAALLAADDPGFADDVRCKVLGTNLFSRVDTIDVSTTPLPTLASLATYDAVLTWSNLQYADAAEIGNLLADYVDQGRGVVQAMANLDGRWNVEGYRPLTDGSLAEEAGLSLVKDVPDHAILSGVNSFNGGMRSSHLSPVSLQRATTLVASWSDGQPMVAEGAGPLGGRVVGLNLFPPSSDAMSEFWDRNTDGARLIANALLFAATDSSNHPPIADAGADQIAEAASAAGASFTLNASASDPDGDPLTFTWLGAISATGQTVTALAPPPTGTKTQSYVVNLTVSDGHGGEATDSVTLTVTDYTGPVLAGVPPALVTANASGPAGAAVTFGPITATDAVDVINPTVTCSHPSGSIFPIGDTTVTCSATDTRGNSTDATFIVRVTETGNPSKSGKVVGYGFIRDSEHHYQFAFAAIEKPSGREAGELLLTVKSEHRSRKGRSSNDHFRAKLVDAVTFSEHSSVLFTGTGRWNDIAGYRYEVSTTDKGKSERDVVRITIKAPGGAVVAHVDGILSGGEVQVWTY
jgi:HYR domain